MDIADFKKLAKNINSFYPDEIENFTYMSEEELEEYQTELESNLGNLSNWDHIRALFTMKNKLDSH